MKWLAIVLVAIVSPMQVQAACDWLAKPEPDAHSIISSRLACLSDPYSRACVEFDQQPRAAREAERLRRIADLELDGKDAANLKERGLWLGATKEMACLAWGKPHEVAEVAANPFGEIWSYDEIDRLHFDGNAIVAINTPAKSLAKGDN
ncbi:hypothetical protein [Pelagibius sp. Alg239-R121]|uniref:hypothetical protein n=1 Tax=Pelagibius sp. Alg239-R121 TaxID=2993448 RepID=UPI0024A77D4A|nr:hypothetical protein [Pelagibius sp. Alg239-R121]